MLNSICLGVKISESLFFQDLIGINCSTACLEYWYREVWDYGHEFEQTPGDSEGQGSLLCCSQWDHKKSDTTERLNNISEFILHFPP